MKKTLTLAAGIFITCFAFAQSDAALSAHMGKTLLQFRLDLKDVPVYEVSYDGRPVITPSLMGFRLAGNDGLPTGNESLQTGFELIRYEKKTFDETWQPVWGEQKNIRNHYEQLTVHLRQKAAPNRLLDICFRVFEDGVGFRYLFPQQPNLNYFIITDELTGFSLAGDHKAFWIPGDYDTNEYPYTISPLSQIDNRTLVAASTDIAVRDAPDAQSVQTPLMLKTADGLYINIHEAGLASYPAMQLHVARDSYKLTAALVPDAYGNKAYMHAPCATPWRTIIISDKATDILASKLILNLNDPSRIKNTSWIKPMKFAGIWWEMQTGVGGWNYADHAAVPDSLGRLTPLKPNGHHSANTANVKRYIDFAARNGIKGLLVEGWNTGWEDWFGNWKEDVFDFVTPYPDFDVKEITRYAAAKGVKMIMHNETSGSATNYERQMDTAFRFMNKYGYGSVKTGYVGKIIPRGEHHDGQWMISHYLRSVKKAADYHVMIDIHEPARPTGMQRTYPNWLACEAGRGNEYNAFSNGNTPAHETILPFTRLMGGPMDYTPGIFRLKGYAAADRNRQVHTTLAKQLALYVTLYSPLQMVADLPENYEAHKDAFTFLRDVPVDWDDTKILEAEPGEYITIARKEKGRAAWYAGAITNENGRTATLDLSFLDKGKKYKATIYQDADNAHWQNNPEAYKITSIQVDNTTKLTIKLAPGGGAAVSIVP